MGWGLEPQAQATGRLPGLAALRTRFQSRQTPSGAGRGGLSKTSTFHRLLMSAGGRISGREVTPQARRPVLYRSRTQPWPASTFVFPEWPSFCYCHFPDSVWKPEINTKQPPPCPFFTRGAGGPGCTPGGAARVRRQQPIACRGVSAKLGLHLSDFPSSFFLSWHLSLGSSWMISTSRRPM